MKDALYKIAKWILSCLILLLGLVYLTIHTFSGVVILVIGLLINPTIFSKLSKLIKFKKTKELNLAMMFAGTMLCMIMMFVGLNLNQEKEIQSKISTLNSYLESGNEKKALETIKQLSSINDTNAKDTAKNIQKLIDKSKSKTYAKDVLLSMSDKQLKLLKEDKLQNKYIEIEYLNNRFIKLLKDNIDKRDVWTKEKIAIEEKKKKEKQEKERKLLLEKQFSAWDGSHRGLTEYIKSAMNDAKSYEHVETKYWDFKDYLVVQTTFRGNNAFGGKVINTIKAEVSLDGKVLKIIE